MIKPTALLPILPSLLVSTVFGEIATYPSPGERYRSPAYAITLTQNGKTVDTFTYGDENDSGMKSDMTDFNHWTSFDFSEPVMVEVQLLADKKIKEAFIHPATLKIRPSIRGDRIRFAIERPGQYFVRFVMAGDSGGDPLKMQGSFGYENPLFIFANPPESDAPDPAAGSTLLIEPGMQMEDLRNLIKKAGKKRIYFAPGEHHLGPQFNAESGTEYYLAGGAYVIGNMVGSNLSDVWIHGRGILSLKGYPRKANVENMHWNLINFGSGKKQRIEGITLTNPSHFCILSRGQLDVDNVKMFGWHYQTDGFGADEGSSIRNSFMKVNDDSVKVYNSDCTAENLVIYHQKNGAIFQFSWGADRGQAENWRVRNIDVVQSDAMRQERSLIEMKKGDGRAFRNYLFESIRCDQDLYNLFAFNNHKGRLERILVRDVEIAGKLRRAPHIKTAKGAETEITFQNVRVNGKNISKASQLDAEIEGKKSKLKFVR